MHISPTPARPPPQGQSAAIGFVLALVALDSLSLGLIVPIVPALVRALSGGDARAASLATGALVATFAVAQLVASPLLGGLSDRFGRRPVLLISIAGMAANALLLAWAPSLTWLFVGRAIAGATAASVSTANAYIADISAPETRARRFGLMGAVASFGFVAGPALGGVLGAVDLRLPFLAAAALAGLNAAYGLFVLPESLPRANRQPFSLRMANPFAALKMLAGSDTTRRLAFGWACFWFALGTLQTTFVLSTGARFGWGPRETGIAFTAFGLGGVVVQGLLVRRIVAWLGERRAAMLGYLASACGFLVMGLATQGWMVFAATGLNALGSVANPAVRAMLSANAGPERQGRMMGALSAVEGVTAIGSPAVAAVLFAMSAGAPFVAAAALYAAGALVVRRVR